MIQIIFSVIALANIQAYEVLLPATADIKAPIVAYIQEHNQKIQEDFPLDGYDWLDMYIIDINNDGQEEYVFLEYGGTDNAVTLRVFEKKNNEIKEMRFPNTFNYFHEFKHPITHECQLFVRVDGVNYICFSNGTYDITRDVYCWKDGIISPCYSSFWVKQQVNIFDELCAIQDFRAAYIFLNDFEKNNKSSLDTQTDLYLLSKIAYAALHNNWINQSMLLVQSIKNNEKYKSLSSALKDEILTIESNCKKNINKKDCDLLNSCDWLLDYENKSSEALIADTRFDLLLSSISPDLLEYDFFGFTETPENIKRYFYWPNSHVDDAENKVSVIEKRYVTFSGCYPHCVCHRGLVWCDVQKNIGVLVLVVKCWRDGEDKVYITSRQLESIRFPQAFLTSLQKWLKDNEVETKQAKFCNRVGIINYITL